MDELDDGVEQLRAREVSRQGRPTLVQASKAAVPRAVFVQCDTSRAITAGRGGRSAQLFGGSIDGSPRNRSSSCRNVHSQKTPTQLSSTTDRTR
jgi:hypothetical protein